VSEAGFFYHTFVTRPFYYQNLLGAMAPQSKRMVLWVGHCPPIPTRVIHMATSRSRAYVAVRSPAELAGAGNNCRCRQFSDFNESSPR